MSEEYDRGYLDGIDAASQLIAVFFQSQKDRDAKAVADLTAAQAMMHGLMLNLLAPLQDKVRALRPPPPAQSDGEGR